jgi:hypothetical protein
MLRASIVITAVVLLASMCTRAQDITVIATNGKTGHPLVNARVLVFEFDRDSSQHDISIELRTDRQGVATLRAGDVHRKKFQLWVDRMSQCAARPHSEAFDVAELRTAGSKGTNDCAGFLDSTFIGPNQVEVFARPATLRERMRW